MIASYPDIAEFNQSFVQKAVTLYLATQDSKSHLLAALKIFFKGWNSLQIFNCHNRSHAVIMSYLSHISYWTSIEVLRW